MLCVSVVQQGKSVTCICVCVYVYINSIFQISSHLGHHTGLSRVPVLYTSILGSH